MNEHCLSPQRYTLEPRITDAYVMRLFDMRVTNIMLLCAHAYILALPLGRYPLGILPERRQAQQHGKSSNGNINGLTKGPIDTLLKATTCNSQVAEPKERLH